VLAGVPGLVDLPFVGKLFAHNRRQTQETDIVLTLTPHIVRVLDLTEADLRPFRVRRDSPGAAPAELPNVLREPPPRDRDVPQQSPAATPDPAAPFFPQPLQPGVGFPQPLQGPLPGAPMPITPPPPKKPCGE
jgi:general secretion pathway protein D